MIRKALKDLASNSSFIAQLLCGEQLITLNR